MFETNSEQVLCSSDAKNRKRKFKVPEIAGRKVSWTSLCLVSLAHGTGIHVSVCVVACLVCQNQFTCELNFLLRSHSLSVCVHASGDVQMD